MGITGWFFGKAEQKAPTAKSTEINYEDVLLRFQEIALEYLNTSRYALMEKDQKKAITLSENFTRAYRSFTDNQSAFNKKGGRLRMAYQILVKSIGPAFQETNIYLNTNLNTAKTEQQRKLAIKKIEEAIRAVADLRVEDLGIAAK